MSSTETKHSPMMLQWHNCKKSAPDAILFFRLGDFYEAFYEDAALIAKELDLTLTKRQEIPMSGIPHHAADAYIDKLIAKGYRVAIAEQMEDPKATKGIVRREIVRVITPGTVIQSGLLTDKSNNFLVCLTPLNAFLGLAVLDITTADFRIMEFESEKELLDELCALKPAELLTSEKCKKTHPQLFTELARHLNMAIHIKEEWHFDQAATHLFLTGHFKVHHLDGFGIKGMTAAITSAGALLAYVKEDLNLPIDHIEVLQPQLKKSTMSINHSTQRHLELTVPAQESKAKRTLIDHLDVTHTPMGGRLLKEWLTHPLLSPQAIGQRHDAVETFLSDMALARELRTELQQIRDLERMMMRIEMNFASPRDLLSLCHSLEKTAAIAVLLQHCTTSFIAAQLEQLKDVSELTSLIAGSIHETPPLRLSDGNVIKTGYHPEIDELRALKTDHHAWIARYQAELKESTGIRTLKVGYTRAFGYYIEVSRSASEKMPDHFERRQTLTTGERYITPELKEHEYKMLHAEEKIAALEQELFHQIRQKIAAYKKEVREIAKAIAGLDAILSLAYVAERGNYVRPVIDTSDLLHIEEGRHPVVEQTLPRGSYVSNDAHLESETSSLLLITGPNMAGKSTYIRQVALIVILAQIGSFVPAKKAHIGIIDKVFSRIGASDDLASGQSTFMVEMTETAEILYNATSKSLVILDEIGRGTSTYDGISIAWSVAEHLLHKKVKTLFATHYSELTRLEEEKPGVVNLNVAVHENGEGIVFLHKILKGAADKSYGIHVAKLAGLPQPVIKRARELLAKLEKGEPSPSKEKNSRQKQLELFVPQPAPHPILEELKVLDLNQMTPLDIFRKVAQWQAQDVL